MESIANAICWIASQMYLLNEDNLRKAAVACGDLALVRDTINQLRKP